MDYNRPSLEVLRDLLYESNEYVPPEHHTTFGWPTALDQRPELPNDPNTFIPMTVEKQEDDRFSDKAGLMYRRTPFAEVLRGPGEVPILKNFPFKLYDVLDQLNAWFDVQLTPDDVYDQSFTDASQVFQLRFKPCALIFIEDIVLNVVYHPVALVSVTDLSGFTEYVPA